MRSRDDANEARAASVRLRAAAPAAAFAFPAFALVVAGLLGVAWAGAPVPWLVALAAPAVVPVTVIGGETPSVVPLVAAAVVSAPVWLGLGTLLGDRARGSWSMFWRLYAGACTAWVLAATAVLWLLG